jgi:endonuclease/exonuclease/phosphatase (EEP) superfamily protein YafD
MAFVAFFGVAATTASMAPYFREPPAHVLASAHFKLVTFNVWFRNDRIDASARFLELSRADVIVLQEVDLAHVDRIAGVLRSYPHRVQTPNVRYGLVIFSRTPLSEVEHLALPGRVTRITRTKTRWHDADVAIIGAHLSWPVSPAPARQRAAELEMIAKRVRRETGPVLLAGDFNLTPWSRFFAQFVESSGLADCALGRGVRGSWPSQVPIVRIRIDQCFASSHWRVRSVNVGPRLGSDHLPVSVELELANVLPNQASRHSSRTSRRMM